MINSIDDYVKNSESKRLIRAIISKKNDLSGAVFIQYSTSSGLLYAHDEKRCNYAFSDRENTKLERHLFCSGCGHENFKSEFKKQATAECCLEYVSNLQL